MQRRKGYTLFEITLVLAVVLIAAGVSFPLIRPLWSDARATAASDVVRARLTEARSRAISDGKAYRFAVMPGTGKFKISPATDESGNTPDGYAIEGELPENVLFRVASGSQASTDGYVDIAVFASNGEAGDADISVGEDGGRQIRVKLRGVTGTVTTEDVAAGGARP